MKVQLLSELRFVLNIYFLVSRVFTINCCMSQVFVISIGFVERCGNTACRQEYYVEVEIYRSRVLINS